MVALMPATTSDILAELDRVLEPQRFEDYCVNGLQVPSANQVQTLATGVSAHAELFELAAREHAQLLLVHHGLFWGSGVATIDALLKRRLQILFDADIALAAYHLPLDAHPQFGNNALLAHALGAGDPEDLTPFALHRGQPIGFLARFPGEGLPAHELFARVAEITQREPLVFDAGPPRVRRLAIVSGAGADYTAEAAAAGADALLTGEPAERSMALAREAGVHLIAAGHYATETLGVRRLGEHLAERFDLRHVFLDVPNPV
ncbi:MAG: Nif3-like dinuclear metal center hexameric protein [Solirubrobacterales bacterium]|nr:Nif3-like dinuclear metal center hexameric protein [Solirubrobacterales bacterium]